jgi:transposase
VWRALPAGLPHWRTVWGYVHDWHESGATARMHDQLREQVRVLAGRRRQPTAVVVTAASVQDRDGARPLLWKLAAGCRTVTLIWADGGYAGKLVTWAASTLRRTVQIVKRPDNLHTFKVLPRRYLHRILDANALAQPSPQGLHAVRNAGAAHRIGRGPSGSGPCQNSGPRKSFLSGRTCRSCCLAIRAGQSPGAEARANR